MERHENPRELASRVITLLEEDLQGEGFSLLDVRVFRGGGRVQIRVYLDTIAGGIALDEVARAARTVNMLLEEADLIAGQYVIEVSSPGIRRPLRTERHFTAAVGQRVDMMIKSRQRPVRVRGLLTACRDGVLVVDLAGPEGDKDPESEPAARKIALSEVLEANLEVDFDPQALINADRRRRKQEHRLARSEKKKTGRAPRPRGKRDGEAGDSQ